LREDVTQTVAILVAASVFLDPEQAAQAKGTAPKAMQYLGSALGMTMKDLQALSPKLASNMAEVMGSESGGSRKRASEGKSAQSKGQDDPGLDAKEPKDKKTKKAEPKGGGKKRKAAADAK